jgi:hypothetical protein
MLTSQSITAHTDPDRPARGYRSRAGPSHQAHPAGLIQAHPAGPVLLAEPGVGAVVAAQLLISWFHPRRVRSEAAFASPNPKSHPWKPTAANAPDTASTAADTGRCTGPCTPSRSRASGASPKPRPTTPGAPFRARPTATSAAASSSPSTVASTRRRQRNWGMTRYRSFTGPATKAFRRSLERLGRPALVRPARRRRHPQVRGHGPHLLKSSMFDFRLSEDEMAQAAAMGPGKSLFFDHAVPPWSATSTTSGSTSDTEPLRSRNAAGLPALIRWCGWRADLCSWSPRSCV